ncbi:hypothetical protein ACFQ0K_08490 [Nocardioides caeni]|uniref:DUF11 domain-containing protein n=1 Tax=Nocardioides caeni TaxID=574700 RepID=A0A4S8N4A1_9ACTN|nr:hypothetical protein [Nocardioides caeni]THV10442.1 hypothetical protein E9934_13990 [Nocardioides caeni]
MLRTGAHALWVAPTIALASTVPGSATSGSPSVTVTANRISKTSLLGTGSVTYDVTATVGGTGSVTGLQVVIANNGPGVDQKVLRPGALLLAATRHTLVNSSGWAMQPANGEGPYVATYLGGADGGEVLSGDSRTFRVRFDNCNTNPTFRVTLSPAASPSTSGSLSTSSITVKPFG